MLPDRQLITSGLRILLLLLLSPPPHQGLDRAQTQAADQITVHLTHAATPTAPTTITIKQNPTALKGSKIRVGEALCINPCS